MTKVLIFLSALVLILNGSFSKADLFEPAFVQTQSNVEGIESDLNSNEDQMATLPIDSRPFFDFNLFSLVAPPTPAAPAPAPAQTMIRVNIFPVLDYGTKDFMVQMPEDIFSKTVKLDGVTLISKGGPFHLTTLSGADISDGTKLSFRFTKKGPKYFLDGKEAPFSGLLVTQGAEAATQVAWHSVRGPFALNYIGNFVITLDRTPRGSQCIKVINVLELEKYISLVTPSEIHPDGVPLAALESQAVAARTYALGKIEWRRSQKLDFDIFGSTQDQFNRGIIFDQDKDKNEIRRPENENVLKAVAKTVKKVLFFGGHLAKQAMYSANCAGRSVSYQDYSHGRSRISYLVSVSENNKESLRRLSTATFNFTTQSLADQLRAVGIKYDGPVLEVDPINLNSSGRATALKFSGPKSTVNLPTSGPQFEALKKRFVSFAASKSDNEFRPYLDSAVAVGNIIILKSYGIGHNVGFCQEGGVLMARSAEANGKANDETYKRILTHYYNGTTVADYVESD